jgi:hypothetical protein
VCFGTFKETAMADQARFTIRWANGHYVIFDWQQFKPVRCAGTQKEIDRIFATGR